MSLLRNALLARGDQPECEKLVDKALKIDPQNLAAVIVKAPLFHTQPAAMSSRRQPNSSNTFPDWKRVANRPSCSLDLYIKSVNWDKATALALRIFEVDGLSLVSRISLQRLYWSPAKANRPWPSLSARASPCWMPASMNRLSNSSE